MTKLRRQGKPAGLHECAMSMRVWHARVSGAVGGACDAMCRPWS
jgi:hypothetical protein